MSQPTYLGQSTSILTAPKAWWRNEKRCTCLYSPSSNRMVCCNACGIWYHMTCKELDLIFAHNTNVYVCHLCINNTFTDILQYLCYSIKCFLNNNCGDPVLALLNNLALLSKDEIRSFTLLTLLVKKRIWKNQFWGSSNSINFKHE